MAVVRNPFASRYVEDLSPLFDIGGALAERLMSEAVAALAGTPVSYGKAAIVGGLENYIPRNSDSIQNLYLKPLRRRPPVRKTGVVPCLMQAMTRNLFWQ